jgi:flavin reductase (DIM6/NTAB) family NADH-FMN oxidoreductase RutF
MRSWPSGVSVVATAAEGVLHGCTVSAFTSVSVTPPLVLVCLDRRSRTCAAVGSAGRFSVNVLGDGQVGVAVRFATPGLGDRFAAVPYRLEHDVPVLSGGSFYMVCTVSAELDAGDHVVVLGTPIAGVSRPDDPLVYVEGTWRSVGSTIGGCAATDSDAG